MKKSYHSIAEPAIAARATLLTVEGLGAAVCALESVIRASHHPCVCGRPWYGTPKERALSENRARRDLFPRSIPRDRLSYREPRVNCYFKTGSTLPGAR